MLESIRLSYRSLREARTLTTMSILIALGLLLGLVTLVPNEFLKICLLYTSAGIPCGIPISQKSHALL